MDNCAVCGASPPYHSCGVLLCSYHRAMFSKWFARWSISTGHKGPINMKLQSVINLLKNIDVISRVKSAKV